MTRPRHQFNGNETRSTFPIEYVRQGETVSAYLDRIAGEYRRSCYLDDLTCRRLAAIALCREVSAKVRARITYRAAVQLLTA